ncbi:MAG: alpha/beta fold hydrolase [Pseudomonadales bacterium]|nr:alpha/beta fold hydrolase [Pseudomonadales bacterium]
MKQGNILCGLGLMICSLLQWAIAEENAEEIVIDNDGTLIAGTLARPDGASGNVPLVIMISDSGAQARDAEIAGFPVFARLAEELLAAGIASFRFDDRQTGASSGEFAEATMDRLAADVAVIVDHFTVFYQQPFSHIVLLGHGQGGIVAGRLAARDTRIDKLVLMASTGVNQRRVLRHQAETSYAGLGLPQALIEEEASAREQLMFAISDEGDVAAAEAAYAQVYLKLLSHLPAGQKQNITDKATAAVQQAAQLRASYATAQMQSFLYHDPGTDLAGLAIPVLLLFGDKDTLVDPALHAPVLEEVLADSRAEYRSIVIPDANHLFQVAETGQVSEYPALEKAFSPALTEALHNWLQTD